MHITNIILASIIALLIGISSALALDLKTAKDKGLLGEERDGYVAVVESPAGDDVRRLVRKINKQRTASYRNQSLEQGTPERIIRERAFRNIFQDMPSGHYFKNENGEWEQR
jgi:uncharacterized protein YdbL (DUF1318 family)